MFQECVTIDCGSKKVFNFINLYWRQFRYSLMTLTLGVRYYQHKAESKQKRNQHHNEQQQPCFFLKNMSVIHSAHPCLSYIKLVIYIIVGFAHVHTHLFIFYISA